MRDTKCNGGSGKRTAHIVFETRVLFSLIGLLNAIDGEFEK